MVHDWLFAWTGSERVLEQILQVVPEADVASAFVDHALVRSHLPRVNVRELWIGKVPGAKRHYQWLLPLEALAFGMLDTSPYDVVISSSHALAKMVAPGRRGVHLCYCYSPPRYLWDLHDTYMATANWPRRSAMAGGRRFLQWLDQLSAKKVTHFVCLSRYVAKRIERVYGRRALVIYPPVSRKAEGDSIDATPRQNFLLYLGRLVPYKRVDLIVKAAAVHGIRTVIAGDGPERERLQAMAGRNVEFMGWVSESEAARLMDTCACFLFCAEEDFGIAPLEANAHGAPVIALRAGATVETMIDGKTAVFFEEPTEEALAAAVRTALAKSWDEKILRENVQRFAPARFRSEFGSALARALDGEEW